MASPKQTAPAAPGPAQDRDPRTLPLRHGRELRVVSDDAGEGVETLEIAAQDGQVELRVILTEAGPVLKLDGVRLAIRAAESVDVQCKTFKVAADESVELSSKGTVDVVADRDVNVGSTEDVRVHGRFIYLN